MSRIAVSPVVAIQSAVTPVRAAPSCRSRAGSAVSAARSSVDTVAPTVT